jgi:hypothetical protein
VALGLDRLRSLERGLVVGPPCDLPRRALSADPLVSFARLAPTIINQLGGL